MKISFSITSTLSLGVAYSTETIATQYTAPSAKQLDEHLPSYLPRFGSFQPSSVYKRKLVREAEMKLSMEL
jgi:hypothetical protein